MMGKRKVQRFISLVLTVVVMVTLFANALGGIAIAVEKTDEQYMEEILERWEGYILGVSLDENNAYVSAYVAQLNTSANEVYTSLIKSRNVARTILWEDLTMNTVEKLTGTDVPARDESGEISTAFARLKTIAQAYNTKGCALYQQDEVKNEILLAWDFLVDGFYNVDTKTFGNWYHWEIGIPQAFLEGMIVMGDTVSQERITTYTKPIKERFVKDCTDGAGLSAPGTMTGANLIDKAVSAAMSGVLTKDVERFEHVKKSIKSIFKYANNTVSDFNVSDDGFWADGSYIQHEGIAYTSGYGSVLYGQLGRFFKMLSGTPWSISYPDECEKIPYDFIFTGIEPLLYDGLFMNMTAGRGVTRPQQTDKSSGVGIIVALMPLVDSMPTPEMAQRMKSMIKYYIGLDEEYFYANCTNIFALSRAQALMKDTSVHARSAYVLHKRYPSMDKVVHTTNEYSFGVSMHSPRTYNYEYINNEGKRLWNVSDGMTYLYNGDEKQYAEDYWATVDPKRMSGTTTEYVMRNDGVGQDKANSFAFVGGTEIENQYGVTGMHLKTLGSSGTKNGTEAKKSWFMFDDEVVALGSGITSQTGNFVETVIDNRKIDNTASNQVTINDVQTDDLLLHNSHEDAVGQEHIQISDATYNGHGAITYNFGQQTEPVTIETRIRFNGLVDFRVHLLDENDKKIGILNTVNDKTMMVYREETPTAKTTDLADHAVNNWLDVKIEVDPTSQTNKITMTLDGIATTISDLAFSNTTEAKPDKISFVTPKLKTKSGTFDIDYLKITNNSGAALVDEGFETFDIDTADEKWSCVTTGTVDIAIIQQQIILSTRGVIKENVDYMHLQGNNNTDIGYYFPNTAKIKALKEVRTGNWIDVGASEGVATSGFATFVVEHGQKPTEEQYGYVVLPNKTAQQTKEYAQKQTKDIEIIAQTNAVHAVKETTLGITGANFWESSAAFVGGMKVDKPASVMVKETDEYMELSLSDPTQKNQGIITLEFDGVAAAIESVDSKVTITQLSPTILMEVDTTTSYGKTFKVKLAKNTDSFAVQSVASPTMVKVDAGTEFEVIALPPTVKVMANNNTEYDMNVTWDGTNYKKDENGVYTIEGVLTPTATLKNPENIKAVMDIKVGGAIVFDFNSDTIGAEPQGWAKTTTTGGIPERNVVKVIGNPLNPEGEEENKAVMVCALDDKFETFIEKEIGSIKGEMSIKMKIYFPKNAELNPTDVPGYAGIHLLNEKTTSNQAVSIMTQSQKIGYRHGDSVGATELFADVSTDVWNDLEIRMDTTTGKQSIWFNGKKYINQKKLRYASKEITKIRIAAPKAGSGTIYVDDIVMDTGAAPNMKNMEVPAGVEVPYDTAFSMVKLPKTIKTTMEDDSVMEVPVVWDGDNYSPTTQGEQIISGRFVESCDYTNTQNFAPTVKITVGEDGGIPINRNIVSINTLSKVRVALGTVQANITFPSEVEVLLEGEKKINMTIAAWSPVNPYTEHINGAYLFEGTLQTQEYVTNTNGLTAQVTVQVGKDEFDILREKWYYQIAGSNDFNENDLDIAAYIKTLDENSDEILENLVVGEAGYYERFMSVHKVFNDYPMNTNDKTGSSQRTLTYDRLKALALSYRTKGCKLYQDETTKTIILAAMNFMFDDDRYSYNCQQIGNWYDWMIGTPLRYLDLMVLMYDELSEQRLIDFTSSVNHFTSTPKWPGEGANQVWLASVVAENAILMKDEEKLKLVAPAVQHEFRYVTEKDGYYEDGSFIQHDYYPYTGGYGKALIVTLAPMATVLADTKYEIAFEEGQLYKMISKSYEPFLMNGGMMDMTRNREISRAGGQDNIAGRQIIRAIITLSGALEGEEKEKCLSTLKQLLLEDKEKQIFTDPRGFFLEYYVGLPHIAMGKEILEDASIVPRGDLEQHNRFPSMARVVHHAKEFAMGIAMHSKTIKTYEVTNTEGTNMWHTADGMMYLYNTDKNKYADNFWGAVDHQRLAGTTVDRYNKKGDFRSTALNTYDFSGGTDILGKYGVTGIELNNGAHAKKSYFMFDDEVVALGSDISATSENPVETIVENYKIMDDMSNNIYVGDKLQVLESAITPPWETRKALEIASNQVGKQVTAKKAFTEQTSGTVILEFDINLPENENFIGISLTSGNANVFHLTSRSGKLGYRISRSGTAVDGMSEVANMTKSTWHKVKIAVDMENDTAQYYFDGIEVTQAVQNTDDTEVDLTHAPLLMDNVTTIDGILLVTPNNGKATGYLDNIKVYQSESPQTLILDEAFECAGGEVAPAGWVRGGTETDTGVFSEKTITLQPPTPARDDEFAKEHTDVSYMHMGGNIAGSDVGYYFPIPTNVTGLRETRTQKWTLMNNYEKFLYDTPVTKSFATFYINHGAKPTESQYEYVVLPGKTKEETAAYSQQSDVEIVENSSKAHIVREKGLNITAANFWDNESYTAGGITADRQASIMVSETATEITVSVGDPTNRSKKPISIELDFPVGYILIGNEKITVTERYPTTKMVVDVEGTSGQSNIITFKKYGSGGSGSSGEPVIPSGNVSGNDTKTIVNAIEKAKTDVVVTLKNDQTEIAKEVFEVLAGKDKNLIIKGSGYTWTMNGKDIKNPATNVDFGVTMKKAVLEEDVPALVSAKDIVLFMELKHHGAFLGEVMLQTNAGGSNAGKTLNLYYLNNDSAEHMGAYQVEANGNVTMKFSHASEYILTTQTVVTFQDIQTHWAKDAIHYLAQKGMIKGIDTNVFAPESDITRAQFVTMLANIAGADMTKEQPTVFEDVAAEGWFAGAVAWANNMGITKGVDKTHFEPDTKITREQMAAMIDGFASAMKHELKATVAVKTFADGSSISGYAVDAVAKMQMAGVINGKDNNQFAPQAKATRAEACMMLSTLLKQMQE